MYFRVYGIIILNCNVSTPENDDRYHPSNSDNNLSPLPSPKYQTRKSPSDKKLPVVELVLYFMSLQS